MRSKFCEDMTFQDKSWCDSALIKSFERVTSGWIMACVMTNLYLYALCTVITVTQWHGFQWILTANKIILTRGTRLCQSVVFLLLRGHQNTQNHKPNSLEPSRQIYFRPYHLKRSKCSKVLQFEWCPQAVESEMSFKFGCWEISPIFLPSGIGQTLYPSNS